jgi:stage III sporulation protein SpoIIIAA
VTEATAHEETTEVVIAEGRHQNLQASDVMDPCHLEIGMVKNIEKTTAEVMGVVEGEAGILTNKRTITTKEAKNGGVNLEDWMMKKISFLIKNLNLILVSLAPLLLKQIP